MNRQYQPSSLCVKRKRSNPSKRPLPLPRRNFHLNTTTVYQFNPLTSLSTHCAWITSATNSKTLKFHHPLTLKPHLTNLPTNLDLTKFDPDTLAVSYHTSESSDKILVFPEPTSSTPNYDDHTLLVLSNGGLLRGQSPSATKWVYCTSVDYFDDIIIFRGNIHALDREGNLYVVTVSSERINIGNPVITRPVSKRTGWRKRLATDGNYLYAMVRVEDNLLHVYETSGRGNFVAWCEAKWFVNRKVLFLSRDYHLFMLSETMFTNMIEYENCIVFAEGAFPKYGSGNAGWEFGENEDDIAVFRVSDGTFAWDGDNDEFPKLDWSPPPWILNASLGSSESCSQSQSECEEDEDLDSNSEDEKDGEMESDSKSQEEGDEQVQCDLKSHENEDEDKHSNANIEGAASLQEDVSSSLYERKFETTGNGGNDAAEQGTSTKNMTQSIPRDCTSSPTKSHKSDSVTSKFEGFDVRSDLIPTLQKIWQKHGNIIEKSTMRSGGMLARALESLAIVVQIIDDISPQSFSDSQVDCLRLTLSDLRCICFKVDWLVPVVEEAVNLHKSKPLLDSFNHLSQLSSQVKEQRAILFDELAKLGEKESKLKEEMAKLSKMIPISASVKLDKPLGSGLI